MWTDSKLYRTVPNTEAKHFIATNEAKSVGKSTSRYFTVWNILLYETMVLLSRILAFVAVFINTNMILSHAWSPWDATIDYDQCEIENQIFINDTELNRLYPRNVMCQSGNATHCVVDFDTVTGVEEYYSRCYELQGRIMLTNGDSHCNNTYNDDGTNATTTSSYFTNYPMCLGLSCDVSNSYEDQLEDPVYNYAVGYGACSGSSTPFFNTSFTGSCAVETSTLRKALAGTYTELNCATSGVITENTTATNATSCVLEYGPTFWSQYDSMCLGMGGHLFVIANKTGNCYQTNESGMNKSSFYSESNVHYCFAGSCTLNSVMDENLVVVGNSFNQWLEWADGQWLYGEDSCAIKYDNLTAVNSTAINSTTINSTAINSTAINSTAINSTAINSTAINSTAVNNSTAKTASDANRSWTYITTLLLAAAASFL
jgi:hypothetical protein